MQCPQCGSDMWDNRQTKKNPKQPDYKCKDKACAHAIWLDSKKPTGAKPASTGTKWTWPELGTMYHRSLLLAKQKLATIKIEGDEQVIAAAATIFIAASRDGVAEPKKELAATPAGDADDESDGVPF